MRYCIRSLKPDHVVHLGDYYDDGAVMAEEFPYTRFHQVPGNCDHYRCVVGQSEILCYDIGGVRFYMTHGHIHRVKSGLDYLYGAARAEGVDIALYGHTHRANVEYTTPWMINPGAAENDCCALLEIENGKPHVKMINLGFN
jgi:putative phosphoesterase